MKKKLKKRLGKSLAFSLNRIVTPGLKGLFIATATSMIASNINVCIVIHKISFKLK